MFERDLRLWAKVEKYVFLACEICIRTGGVLIYFY